MNISNEDELLHTNNYNIKGELMSNNLIIKNKIIKNVDNNKLSEVIKGNLILKDFLKESINNEKINDEKKINEAINLLKSVSPENLKSKNIKLIFNEKDNTKKDNTKKDNTKKDNCEKDNKKKDNICKKRVIGYNQYDVPVFGFKNGWKGPQYWSFANGLPYNNKNSF